MRLSTLFTTVVSVSATASALSFVESLGAIKRDLLNRRQVTPVPASGGSGGGGGGSGGSGGGGSGGGGPPSTTDTCPAIWLEIGAALRTAFTDVASGQCNDNARAAIRAAFHDCGAWNITNGLLGGCDGSLVIADEASLRSENDGLQDIANFYTEFAANFSNQVSMADLLQFGAASAILTCPGGPAVQTFVGRVDWTTEDPPNQEGLLPSAFSNSTVLINLFAAKGFDAAELVALIGAHTTSKQQFVNPTFANESQDNTPGVWDVTFYTDTQTPPPGVYVIPSDTALLNDPQTNPTFVSFQGSQHEGVWAGKFAPAMTKISLLGLDGSVGLIDCTASLPPAIPNTVVGGGTGGPGKREEGFSFLSPKIKREDYKNFHKW